MPIVQIHILEGTDLEKKRLLVKRMTEVICDTLERKPEQVRIILNDMQHDNYAIAGVLRCDNTPT
jgi:4-oxalocrotonate tautomerase